MESPEAPQADPVQQPAAHRLRLRGLPRRHGRSGADLGAEWKAPGMSGRRGEASDETEPWLELFFEVGGVAYPSKQAGFMHVHVMLSAAFCSWLSACMS